MYNNILPAHTGKVSDFKMRTITLVIVLIFCAEKEMAGMRDKLTTRPVGNTEVLKAGYTQYSFLLVLPCAI